MATLRLLLRDGPAPYTAGRWPTTSKRREHEITDKRFGDQRRSVRVVISMLSAPRS